MVFKEHANPAVNGNVFDLKHLAVNTEFKNKINDSANVDLIKWRHPRILYKINMDRTSYQNQRVKELFWSSVSTKKKKNRYK